MYLVSFTAGGLAEVYEALKQYQSMHGASLTARMKVEERLQAGGWDELDPADFGDDDWAKPDCMP